MGPFATSTAQADPAASDGDAGSGSRALVAVGTFDYAPAPPERDVLAEPLALPNLPVDRFPKEPWLSRITRFLTQYHLWRPTDRTRLAWKVHDAVAGLVASTTLERRDGAEGGAPAGVSITPIRHPYDILAVLDLVIRAGGAPVRERRLLEALVARVLDKHAALVAAALRAPFEYHVQAREHFRAAITGERALRRIVEPGERFAMVLHAYASYFHGSRYYACALIRKEPLEEPDEELFTTFCRSALFMAKIDPSGNLLNRPVVRRLPTRRELLFYVKRDPTVIGRIRTDPRFAHKLKVMFRAFPPR